jgi:hypothetical protein
MPKNSVKVYKPKVTTLDITPFDGATPEFVSDIRMSHSFGGISDCQLLLQPAQGNEGDVQVVDTPTAISAFTSATRLVSDHLASRGTDLDVSLTVDPGLTTLGFKGYITDAAPSYGLRENGVKLGVTGPEAILSTVSPQIYQKLYARKEKMVVPDGIPLKEVFSTALKEMQSALITEGAMANFYPDSEKDTAKSIAVNNKPGIEFLSGVFSNTESKRWDALLAGASKTVTSKDLVTFVMAVLSATPGDGLLSAMRVIGSAFGLVYVPDITSFGPGKLVDVVEILDTEPVDIELDMEQVQFFVSSSGIITPRRVTVMGKSSYTRREDAKSKTPVATLYSLPIITSYPEGEDDGFSLPTTTPPWWKAYYKDNGVNTSGIYTVDNLKKVSTEHKKVSEERRDNSSRILQYWARIAYTNKIGNMTTAAVSGLPLSGDYKPGNLIRLTNKEGGVLGTGLITKVQHNLSVGSNKVDAGTHLTLSYVTF